MADNKKSDSGNSQQAGVDLVADTIKGAKGLDAGAQHMAPAVQSTTTVTPAEADKSSLPNANDAKSEDPPVRAGKPDTPIAQTLAAGAGAHDPPDQAVWGPDGRIRPDAD